MVFAPGDRRTIGAAPFNAMRYPMNARETLAASHRLMTRSAPPTAALRAGSTAVEHYTSMCSVLKA